MRVEGYCYDVKWKERQEETGTVIGHLFLPLWGGGEGERGEGGEGGGGRFKPDTGQYIGLDSLTLFLSTITRTHYIPHDKDVLRYFAWPYYMYDAIPRSCEGSLRTKI